MMVHLSEKKEDGKHIIVGFVNQLLQAKLVAMNPALVKVERNIKNVVGKNNIWFVLIYLLYYDCNRSYI